MSRAFSEIIRGNLRSAKEYNPDSPLIFAFFLIQGIQRITVSLILLKRGRTARQVQGGSLVSGKRLSHRPGAIRYLPASDAALSLALFVYCFYGQIRAMVELFQQL
jgi:hypothetical protein